jgi:hypothetical protein
MRLVDVPLLALRSCCGAGIELPEAVAVATVLALLTIGRLGPGMADGEECEKEEEEEDGPSPERGAAIAARRGSSSDLVNLMRQGGSFEF